MSRLTELAVGRRSVTLLLAAALLKIRVARLWRRGATLEPAADPST